MREQWARVANLVRDDNRYVIASMLAEGMDVPDHVEDLGATYVPEVKRWQCDRCRRISQNVGCCGVAGDPVLDIFGMRGIQERGTFSCGCACAYESAVWTEKYGLDSFCEGVAQGDDDYHGMFITPRGAVDPVARYLGERGGPPPPTRQRVRNDARCSIHGGRVVCEGVSEVCCLGDNGVWNCPSMPELHGKKERVMGVQQNVHGTRWGRTQHGAAVPVCRVPASAGRGGRR